MYILGTLFIVARGKSRSFMSHTKSQILVVFVSSTMFVCLDYGSNIAYALFLKKTKFFKKRKRIKLLANSSSSSTAK